MKILEKKWTNLMKKLNLNLFSLLIIFFLSLTNFANSEEKFITAWGSNISVIDGDTIAESSHSSLANIIDDLTTGTNMFQMGGHGALTGIQLRGLEKRYSTVYIDGVKMLDPSSSDGSFYMENIMKNSIDRVEVLKGTQSSLYGSNAIGGTIHIFTKKIAQKKSLRNQKNITEKSRK